jgi:hypothetical protein
MNKKLKFKKKNTYFVENKKILRGEIKIQQFACHQQKPIR